MCQRGTETRATAMQTAANLSSEKPQERARHGNSGHSIHKASDALLSTACYIGQGHRGVDTCCAAATRAAYMRSRRLRTQRFAYMRTQRIASEKLMSAVFDERLKRLHPDCTRGHGAMCTMHAGYTEEVGVDNAGS